MLLADGQIPFDHGMQFSFRIILWSKIGQPDYIHVNTCHNIRIMQSNANIDEKPCLSDF